MLVSFRLVRSLSTSASWPQEIAILLRRRGGQVLFLDVTARKRGPWCRQRGREPSRKRGRHCSIYRCRRHRLALFRSSSSLSFVLLFVVRLAHLVPATAPPRLTRPGPAAAWLVAEAAAEAAAVQATWRRLERDTEKERRRSSSARSLSLFEENFVSSTVWFGRCSEKKGRRPLSLSLFQSLRMSKSPVTAGADSGWNVVGRRGRAAAARGEEKRKKKKDGQINLAKEERVPSSSREPQHTLFFPRNSNQIIKTKSSCS